MHKKIVGLVMSGCLLLTPVTVLARGEYADNEAVQDQYVASARETVDAHTRPDYPLLNAAVDNVNIRDNEYTRFVEGSERHFVTIFCEEDEKAVFGHEEMCGIEPNKTYDVEIFIRNDASLCLEHSPLQCDKTLQDVKVKAAYPDSLMPKQSGCITVEISSANGTTKSAVDFVELFGASEEQVFLRLAADSLMIESDGLTDGMTLDHDTFFGTEGAEVGYFSLDSGIPAGYFLKVKFKIQT